MKLMPGYNMFAGTIRNYTSIVYAETHMDIRAMLQDSTRFRRVRDL